MSIVNPTGIGPLGNVSNSLRIFAVGTKGTSTTDGCTETIPPTPTDHFEKNRGYQHLPTLMHELIRDVISVHHLGSKS